MAEITDPNVSQVTFQADLAMGGLGVHLTKRAKTFSRPTSFTIIDDSAGYDFFQIPLVVGGSKEGSFDAKYTGDAADRTLQSMFESPVWGQPIVYADGGGKVGAEAVGIVLQPTDGSTSAPKDDAQMRSYSGTRMAHTRGTIGSSISGVGDNMFRHEDDNNWRTLSATTAAKTMETPNSDTKDKNLPGAGHVGVGKPMFVWYTYRNITGAPAASLTATGTFTIASRTTAQTLSFRSSLFCSQIDIVVSATDTVANIITKINNATKNRSFPLFAEASGAQLKLTYRDPIGVLTISGSFATANTGMSGILYPTGPIATIRNVTGTGGSAVKTAIAGPYQLWAASTEPRHIVAYTPTSGGNTTLYVQTKTSQVMSLQYMHGFFGEE